MKTFSNWLTRRKPAQRSRRVHAEGVPLAVRVPVYVAAAGLFCVYAGGYLGAGLGLFAWGLIGVTAMAEFLKPQLGELAARALEERDAPAQHLTFAAASVAVVIGAFGGVVAMHVAEAPRAAYEALQRAALDAGRQVDAARRLVDAVPTCTPEMPSSRCDRMIAENGPILTERRLRLAEAVTLEAEARRQLARHSEPGAGLPNVELWHKALFVGGAEFLMFGVPFAALRLRRRKPDAVKSVSVAQEPETPRAPAPKIKENTGGWEVRRLRYGPTGRKSRQEVLAH